MMEEPDFRTLIQRLIDRCSLPPQTAEALLRNILQALRRPPDDGP